MKKVLVGLVVAVLLVLFVEPSEFRVERTTTIAAPVDAVFEHVNGLHKWGAWSPWAKLDPDAKVAFEGPDAGKDAAMSWSGNDKICEGRMTVVESKPHRTFMQKVFCLVNEWQQDAQRRHREGPRSAQSRGRAEQDLAGLTHPRE
jgi:hypothetical protein